MNTLFSLTRRIVSSARRVPGPVLFATVVLLAGCQSETKHSTASISPSDTPNLDAEIARATQLNQPILILIAEPERNRAQNRLCKFFADLSAKTTNGGAIPILLDVSISRNRAEVTRYHVTNTPMLVCLSPRGVIIARSENLITKELIMDRMKFAAKPGRALDEKLAKFESAIAKNKTNAPAQLDLADFLLTRQNAREAIPYLATAARSPSADTTERIRAWVEQCLAHFWIFEPEKGRHEADDLIAVLGPKAPEARAAGNFVLGVQDASAKRLALARREFEAAVSAAPKSVYGRQASDALVGLPQEGK